MTSKCQIRAIKRNRYTRVSYDDDDFYVMYGGDPYETHGELRSVPRGPHAPNTNEARMLRRLMAQTGLSEEQLRERKCYRIKLSEAQTAKGTKTALQRFVLRFRKRITRELELAREHPRVLQAFLAAWPDYVKWRGPMAQVSGLEAWNAVKGL